MSSILTDVKELSNLSADNTSYDTQVIIYINTLFGFLNQMGVGPATPYSIEDSSEEWADFSPDKFIQTTSRLYVTSKTKLLFDPPITVAHIEALKSIIAESEWRLQSYIIAPPATDGL